ncbi:hypothetical protein CNMCM8980_005227 [Aspergillus fumigatiaffinis]|uniref:Carbohydrate kinase PfkB domain-containing protein n=1 Tax=Aspergillus fumigatiaffinis TaxID=340414 RepID=A0A8H4GYW2_9EURO|nr:hypothetical protein CNMCM5878_000561 [Aspergillus fumigatiaffinis]KAF4231016.1 hypothetical protein CNMCM6805_000334 [Aspergillus fumigatiaffinis]KAF4231580.1 hypothetical protein CNMCM8980_005227 [Aspergillus fumigatiaffinis]
MNTLSISFTSLGLVVLDEIRFPNQEPLLDTLGGSGAYATLGARLFLRPPLSRTLGWMIRTGNDFPKLMMDRLKSWDATLIVEREADKPSTRGLLEYEDTTETLHLHHTHPPSPRQQPKKQPPPNHKSIPLPRNPPRHANPSLNPPISQERSNQRNRPKHIPPLHNLGTSPHVDVLSPNHLELAALFGESPAKAHDKATIEALARRILDSGVGPDGTGTVVVRAGENGSVVVARSLPPTWLPPFYTSGPDGRQPSKVVDPTGAGNAFLGAYAVGYLRTGNAVEAACYGTVGGSFALEQVGMPELVSGGDGELWNGVDVFERLREYREVVGLGN